MHVLGLSKNARKLVGAFAQPILPDLSPVVQGYLQMLLHPSNSKSSSAFFSSETTSTGSTATESVKEIHDKIVESVSIKRTMSPNSWLWSLIANCEKHDDIELLFSTLQTLRVFRMSNLRIHANFNCCLCLEVARACSRAGAIEFGKKVLFKHNVFGLTPSISSANHLLSYARDHNDVNLMVDILKLLKRNNVQVQPSTVDIVFSICYKMDDLKLMSKHSSNFLKAGVNFRSTTFDMWMDLAARRGDVTSLWKVENLRSKSMRQHTLSSGFSCAKGFLLEQKPNEAANVIQMTYQLLPEAKKPTIAVELHKLVNQWLPGLKSYQLKRKEEVLETNITTMLGRLQDMGVAMHAT